MEVRPLSKAEMRSCWVEAAELWAVIADISTSFLCLSVVSFSNRGLHAGGWRHSGRDLPHLYRNRL